MFAGIPDVLSIIRPQCVPPCAFTTTGFVLQSFATSTGFGAKFQFCVIGHEEQDAEVNFKALR